MGLRGPAPQPTAIRLANGNPGKRPMPEGEPKPTGDAVCPDWLPTAAKHVWVATAPRCLAMGTLTAADTDQFASYCLAMATAKEAAADVERNGITEETERGVCKRAAVAIMLDAQRLAMQIGARFGLTPSDRTRISVGKQDEGDPFAKLMAGG